MVSARSGLPRRWFSARAVSVNGNGSSRAACAAAAMRWTEQLDRIQPPIRRAAAILDRTADQPGLRRKAHGERGIGGCVAEAVFHVGRDRQRRRRDDVARMRQRLVARQLAVAAPEHARGRAAGGGQRLEAQAGQQFRRAGIPGIRHHEGVVAPGAAHGSAAPWLVVRDRGRRQSCRCLAILGSGGIERRPSIAGSASAKAESPPTGSCPRRDRAAAPGGGHGTAAPMRVHVRTRRRSAARRCASWKATISS